MNELKKNKQDIDDQLADFTDQILSKEITQKDENPFAPDRELRALEQTALRLKNAFKDDGPSETVIQRMHQKIAMHQQQEKKKSEPFWSNWIPSRQKWQPQHRRQRVGMILYAATVLGLFLISIFLFNGGYSDQPAASGQNLSAGFLVAVGGLILFAIWFFRRKR
jgi:hypothetical protein